MVDLADTSTAFLRKKRQPRASDRATLSPTPSDPGGFLHVPSQVSHKDHPDAPFSFTALLPVPKQSIGIGGWVAPDP